MTIFESSVIKIIEENTLKIKSILDAKYIIFNELFQYSDTHEIVEAILYEKYEIKETNPRIRKIPEILKTNEDKDLFLLLYKNHIDENYKISQEVRDILDKIIFINKLIG